MTARGIALLTAFLATTAAQATTVNLDDFTQDRTQLGAIGFYSSGCLDSSYRLAGDEPGLLKLFVERERWYGTPLMIETLTGLGQAYDREWRLKPVVAPGAIVPTVPERIQIGDIAQRGGGRVTRHASHQTGLDADVVYLRKNHRETNPERGAEVNFDEIFVHNGRVTANLDTTRTWWVWRWLYRTGKVNRIFVDPRIKKAFCVQAEALEPDDIVERIEILRRLRPYENHMDHFHLRLECPNDDPSCVAQEPVPPGAGCTNVELGLVTREIEEHKPNAPAVPVIHRLPKACSDHGRFPFPRELP